MGKTCEPKAFSFQCMTKFTTKKIINKVIIYIYIYKKEKTLFTIIHIIDIFLTSPQTRCPGAGVILLVGRMVRPGCPGWCWPAGA